MNIKEKYRLQMITDLVRYSSGEFERIHFGKANDVWFLCKTNLGRLSFC
jgi:hypothetical protein